MTRDELIKQLQWEILQANNEVLVSIQNRFFYKSLTLAPTGIEAHPFEICTFNGYLVNA